MAAMQRTRDNGWPFLKMHGLGNDFVVIDTRARDVAMTPDLAAALADRHRGVGFDQLALISNRSPRHHLTFYNADGSLSAACGNATRCIADLLMWETQTDTIEISTDHGTLSAKRSKNGLTSVNMGHPRTDWADIPLSQDVDTLSLPIDGTPVATNMGNPHCTFFVESIEGTDLETLGPQMEHHPIFPDRTNVQIAQVLAPDHIRMRVWERGTGITLASGSSSCAAAVAAHRRGLTERSVKIDLDGGRIWIDWEPDGVWMTGPTAHVFSGTVTQDFLDNI